jgi:phospholipase C
MAGFYDHVSPTAAEHDDPAFRQYGVRVPAFVVSSWVDRRSVSNVAFDHTSIIKTILLRFCRAPSGGIPDMGARVKSANHLGGLLRLSVPRGAPSFAQHKPAIDQIANARAEEVRTTFQMAGVRGKTPQELTEFQRGLLAASLRYAASRRMGSDAPQRKVPKKSVPRKSSKR